MESDTMILGTQKIISLIPACSKERFITFEALARTHILTSNSWHTWILNCSSHSKFQTRPRSYSTPWVHIVPTNRWSTYLMTRTTVWPLPTSSSQRTTTWTLICRIKIPWCKLNIWLKICLGPTWLRNTKTKREAHHLSRPKSALRSQTSARRFFSIKWALVRVIGSRLIECRRRSFDPIHISPRMEETTSPLASANSNEKTVAKW